MHFKETPLHEVRFTGNEVFYRTFFLSCATVSPFNVHRPIRHENQLKLQKMKYYVFVGF